MVVVSQLLPTLVYYQCDGLTETEHFSKYLYSHSYPTYGPPNN